MVVLVGVGCFLARLRCVVVGRLESMILFNEEASHKLTPALPIHSADPHLRIDYMAMLVAWRS
jgi:hypothetical protein